MRYEYDQMFCPKHLIIKANNTRHWFFAQNISAYTDNAPTNELQIT